MATFPYSARQWAIRFGTQGWRRKWGDGWICLPFMKENWGLTGGEGKQCIRHLMLMTRKGKSEEDKISSMFSG